MPTSYPSMLRASRLRPLALGLILPLALCGPVRADPPSWVDPPARPAGKAAAPDEDRLPKAAAIPAVTPAANANRTVAPTPPARVAASPSAADAAPRPVAGPASAGRAAAARAFAADYLAAVSSPGEAMLGAAPRFYGARVRFYGRPTTLGGLIAEKRSFIRRWPERRYAARAIRTACDAAGCTVRAIVDFRAANPGRGAVSRGSAELVLALTFSGSRPVIVAESGRVLRRGAQAGTLAPSRGRA